MDYHPLPEFYLNHTFYSNYYKGSKSLNRFPFSLTSGIRFFQLFKDPSVYKRLKLIDCKS